MARKERDNLGQMTHQLGHAEQHPLRRATLNIDAVYVAAEFEIGRIGEFVSCNKEGPRRTERSEGLTKTERRHWWSKLYGAFREGLSDRPPSHCIPRSIR